MEEEQVYLKNDFVRGIERLILEIRSWKDKGGSGNPRETALVITKLEEAKYWGLQMIDRNLSQ